MGLIALAGQPNCGKSTLFNLLTGASQHVANYPGVTVEKKTGWYTHNSKRLEVVDLPGTYSLTSYSPEEKVARNFLVSETPTAVINVADASNLKRNLYLTLQLLEMEAPVIMMLNMMDVAERRGIGINIKELEHQLGIKVIPASMKTGEGKDNLRQVLDNLNGHEVLQSRTRIDYGRLEPFLRDIENRVKDIKEISGRYSPRWLAVKLFENDMEVISIAGKFIHQPEEFLGYIKGLREKASVESGGPPEHMISFQRYRAADTIIRLVQGSKHGVKKTLSDRIDNIVCHRFLGPVILVGVIYLLYYLSIVQGYNLTNYTWPFLAKFRSLTESILPSSGFIEIPLITSFVLWFVDSINALLNYIPIFFILFGLIAILEDSGYMPRMAFIFDKLFHRYGLHGQSTLPMVLGGIYVGGCAVPAIMSCRGIPDERSRLATILIIPMLNCLAKIPLYILLINIYFAAHKGLAMFFISTISLLIVLPVARLLTATVLRKKETAPFIMEMPPYHMPTIRGVLGLAVERVWLFIRKIITIVAAVAVVLFVLLQYPGLDDERKDDYENQKKDAIARFNNQISGSPFSEKLGDENLMSLVIFSENYKSAKMMAKGKDANRKANEKFEKRNPEFFKIVSPDKESDGEKVNKALKNLIKTRKGILREIRKEKINNSYLGRIGKAIEPVTCFAGFNRNVNIALLSSFAAKESSVATLGALYEQEEEGESLEERMAKGEEGFTSLHALAVMLFMVLYPPCIATTIMVKVQTGSVKWMLFSLVYPMVLGLAAATLVYSGGSALGLNGLEAMFAFYGLALCVTIVLGLVNTKSKHI
ncbi:MAG: ferrous iron transport protein B [Deltaproteobacteria bacterium]|nr:ferrous iron transport protein B [Deltaproteobacteria bacterium]